MDARMCGEVQSRRSTGTPFQRSVTIGVCGRSSRGGMSKVSVRMPSGGSGGRSAVDDGCIQIHAPVASCSAEYQPSPKRIMRSSGMSVVSR